MTETTGLRTCIGSTRFGIEAHEAAVSEFPIQQSQRDGLGRMCRSHWNVYTAGLARDAKARKAAAENGALAEASLPATDGTAPAPKATALRARKGGPIGSEPAGPVEILPGGKARRVASTPQGNRYTTLAPANNGGGQSPD